MQEQESWETIEKNISDDALDQTTTTCGQQFKNCYLKVFDNQVMRVILVGTFATASCALNLDSVLNLPKQMGWRDHESSFAPPDPEAIIAVFPTAALFFTICVTYNPRIRNYIRGKYEEVEEGNLHWERFKKTMAWTGASLKAVGSITAFLRLLNMANPTHVYVNASLSAITAVGPFFANRALFTNINDHPSQETDPLITAGNQDREEALFEKSHCKHHARTVRNYILTELYAVPNACLYVVQGIHLLYYFGARAEKAGVQDPDFYISLVCGAVIILGNTQAYYLLLRKFFNPEYANEDTIWKNPIIRQVCGWPTAILKAMGAIIALYHRTDVFIPIPAIAYVTAGLTLLPNLYANCAIFLAPRKDDNPTHHQDTQGDIENGYQSGNSHMFFQNQNSRTTTEFDSITDSENDDTARRPRTYWQSCTIM